MSRASDAQLVELLKLGDSDAVRYWFSTYLPKLKKFISIRLENPQDAEELAQQTFLNCMKNLPLFLNTSSLWTWMVGVAKHEVADYYRRKYAKKAVQTLPLSQFLLAEPVADAHEISLKVMTVLKKMSTYSKELLLKKYIDKQTVEMIADDLGKTAKSIESELFRARKEFKLLYKAEQ
jgi:RNA polymerase sigma-70 factor (ECF subfamily)